MAVLADGEVVFSCADEGFWWVESSRVEDLMDCDGKEVGEGLQEGGVVCDKGGWRGHCLWWGMESVAVW